MYQIDKVQMYLMVTLQGKQNIIIYSKTTFKLDEPLCDHSERCFARSMTLRNTAILPLHTPNFTSGMDTPLSDISYQCSEK